VTIFGPAVLHFHCPYSFRVPGQAAADPEVRLARFWALYFDPAHVAEQDRRNHILRRQLVDEHEHDGVLTRTCRVVPGRQLPGWARAALGGELSFDETLSWVRGSRQLRLTVVPSVLSRRIHIDGSYELTPRDPDRIDRSFAGTVRADLALVGGRVEREIVRDLERSLAEAGRCTQAWLDRDADRAADGA
jgi:hypothetical protein